jgi:hypothetical protein
MGMYSSTMELKLPLHLEQVLMNIENYLNLSKAPCKVYYRYSIMNNIKLLFQPQNFGGISLFAHLI